MSTAYSHMAYPQCSYTRVYYRPYYVAQCDWKGQFHEYGKDYCGVHAPSRIAARAAKREAQHQGAKEKR